MWEQQREKQEKGHYQRIFLHHTNYIHTQNPIREILKTKKRQRTTKASTQKQLEEEKHVLLPVLTIKIWNNSFIG